MNPAEACRYMADPANWYDATFTTGVELKWPGTGEDGPWNAQKLAAMALSDTAEIIPTRRVVVRQQDKPCVVCRQKIEPGTAYVVDGPKHVRCAGPRR